MAAAPSVPSLPVASSRVGWRGCNRKRCGGSTGRIFDAIAIKMLMDRQQDSFLKVSSAGSGSGNASVVVITVEICRSVSQAVNHGVMEFWSHPHDDVLIRTRPINSVLLEGVRFCGTTRSTLQWCSDEEACLDAAPGVVLVSPVDSVRPRFVRPL